MEGLPPDLAPYATTLGTVVRNGLSLFVTRYKLVAAHFDLRTLRSAVHNTLVEVAKKECGSWSLRNNLFLINHGPHRIKIKMLSPRLITSNHHTQASLDFMRQRHHDDEPQQPYLSPDFAITNWFLGYVPDPIALQNSAVWLVRPEGTKKIVVKVELTNLTSTTTSVDIPTGVTSPNVQPKRDRVKPKKVHKFKDKEGA